MRVVIRVGHEDKFYSLVCINEDSKGIYLILYGGVSGMHFSYHADGKMSLRTANHETLQKFADFPPIREIECFQLFLPQTQAISADALMHMGTEYKKDDAKSTTAIFLNSDILGDNLSVHSYILNRDKEQDFAAFLQRQDYANVFRILACNIFTLDKFPDHKVALVILGRK